MNSKGWQRRRRGRVGALTGAVLVFFLAACGSSPETPQVQPLSAHNEADVQFARQLIQLDQQAILISNLVESESSNPAAEKQAQNLASDLNERIGGVYVWLEAWGVGNQPDAPAAPGLMTENQIDALTGSTASSFGSILAARIAAQELAYKQIAKAELAHGINHSAGEVATGLMNNPPDLAKLTVS